MAVERAGLDEVATFRVARNPEGGSQLPYLLWLPLPDGPLVLKSRETWPRTARVFCQPGTWPDDADLLEEVPVRACQRRGPAVDLVLDRARENRSQLVFTTLKGGRPAIFWQTARTAKKVAPGLRLPTRRAAGHDDLVVLVDTRERYPWKLSRQQAATQRRALPAGDYGVEVGGEVVAVVERKSLDNLAADLSSGALAFALAELATVGRAAVVVEGRWSALLARPHVTPGFLAEQLAACQARYPQVPIVFAESRQLAEEWAYRWLGACRRELGG